MMHFLYYIMKMNVEIHLNQQINIYKIMPFCNYIPQVPSSSTILQSHLQFTPVY